MEPSVFGSDSLAIGCRATEPTLVPRPRLLRALDQAAAARLTLIVAPAGYGKTTLLTEWCTLTPDPSPWEGEGSRTLPPRQGGWGGVIVALSEMDNEGGRFLGSLVAGMQAHVPDFEPTVDLSGPLSYALTRLVQQAGQVAAGPWRLVLDDYHLVTNSAIHQAVDTALGLPALPLHLVIASRGQPPLPTMARLRVEGRLVELDEADLRFTPDEMQQLLAGSGLELDETSLRRVVERTEGWPVALQLVCQAARREPRPDLGTILGRIGDERPLFDYLAGQVLARQSAAVQDFLRRTSLLPYLSTELCNAFLDMDVASAILDDLECQHLFISSLDDKPGRHYRYHALFQEFLRRGLEQTEGAMAVIGWRRRAAACLIQRPSADGVVAAIDHLLAVGDWADAAVAVEGQLGSLDEGQLALTAGWFDRFPPAILTSRPRLLVALGRLRARQGRWAEAIATYTQAERLIESSGGDALELCRVLHGHAWVYLWQGQRTPARALALRAEAAWHSASAASPRELAEVYTLLAACGEPADIQGQADYQQRALEIFSRLGDRRGEAGLLGNIASTLLGQGRLREALETADLSRRIYDELGSYNVWRALVRLGETYLLSGEPDLARAPLERQLRLGDVYQDAIVRAYALYLLGHAHRQQGHPQTARDCYDEARRLGEALQEPFLLFESRLGLALLALAEGDRRAALWHGQAARRQAQAVGNRYQEGLALMALGLVVSQGGDARQAEASWGEALSVLQALGANLYHATLRLYLADLCHGQGRDAEALDHLSEALSLSQAYDYEFLFTRCETQRAVPLLVLALGQTSDVSQTSDVCRLLVQIGQEAVEPLLGLLAAAPVEVQARVADLLGEIGDERATPALSALSQNPDRRLQESAAAALALIAAAPRPPLRIVALGGFQVQRGDIPIPAEAWQRRKARLLLLYLLAQAPRRVPGDELIEALWPDLPPPSARRVLNTTFSDLRRILEPYLDKGQPSRYLARDQETLSFSPTAETWYDVAAFERAARAGGPAVRQALELYRGDLVPEEPYVDWVLRERERLHGLYLNTLTARLEEQVQAGAWREGADLARRILDREPWLEEVWRALITCLARLGRRGEALQAYQACIRALHDELDTTPSAETVALYEGLKA